MKKFISVIMAITIGFLASLSFDIKADALDTDKIRELYWGYYRTSANSTYLLAITGEQSISFRGKYDNVVLSGNTPNEIFFSPGATNTPDNFQATFTAWARLDTGSNSFIPQVGSRYIAAHYSLEDDWFEMDAGETSDHIYVER